jgi:hypothetical protein
VSIGGESRARPLLGVFVRVERDDLVTVLDRAADLALRQSQDLLVVIRRPVISEFGLRFAGMKPEKVFLELEMSHRRVVRGTLGAIGDGPSYSISTTSWPAVPRAIQLAAREECSLLILPGGLKAARATYRSIASRLGLKLHFVP